MFVTGGSHVPHPDLSSARYKPRFCPFSIPMTSATPFPRLRFALILLLSGLSGFQLLGSAARAEEVNLLEALESVTTEELKGHIDFLADDTLEGREAGSRGGHAAATYLVKEFEKHKLVPAGDNNSYFQGFNGASRNILGVLEGSDPKLKQEVIVLAAHYDHVGYGRAGNSYGPFGYIHNGADDNASGVSGLLEIIDAIRRLPTPPKRTILFALWDAEEQGLIGSRFWISRPTLPLQRVVLDINIDMIGRLKDDKVEAYGSRTLVGSRRLLSELNTATQLALDFDWRIKADSDHHPFFAQNIPFLMLHTCLHENYHRPSDDVHLLNFTGMQRVTRLTLETLLHYAEVEKIPKFREISRSESPREQQILEQSQLPQRPRFGLPWKKEAGEELQIIFQAPTAGSPADRLASERGTSCSSLMVARCRTKPACGWSFWQPQAPRSSQCSGKEQKNRWKSRCSLKMLPFASASPGGKMPPNRGPSLSRKWFPAPQPASPGSSSRIAFTP